MFYVHEVRNCCVLAIFERRRDQLGSKISGYGQLAEVTVYFAMPGLSPLAPSAFQLTQSLSPWHTHPGAQEILYLVEGNLTVEVEGQRAKPITAGDIVLTPAEVPHSVRNAGTSVTAKAVVMHSRADKDKPLLVNVKK
jgi:mannose-6-phosphate isomerase-like protein (cupin superfamily)